ncbi:MAG: trypsin-like peptidase domain-containing protein [Pirellulaceae bacterium]|nr:trypsin-like peptidase domain-containing protein [Pirellulaceae bacterium]
MNDQSVQAFADLQVNRLIQSDRGTTLDDLAEQLDRKTCQLQIAKESRDYLPTPKLYTSRAPSVVVLIISRKHQDHWHATLAATGFVISEDGAVATNRHLLRKRDEYLFALTFDRRLIPITKVLASNEKNDAAILQMEGSGFTPIALRSGVAVGAPIRILSHPKSRLFTLTQGIVSRRFSRAALSTNGKEGEEQRRIDFSNTTKWVTVTADFGKGSSGAPVFDRFGNAIAVATSTSSITVERDEDSISQMVFRDCVAAEVFLAMIEPTSQRGQ